MSTDIALCSAPNINTVLQKEHENVSIRYIKNANLTIHKERGTRWLYTGMAHLTVGGVPYWQVNVSCIIKKLSKSWRAGYYVLCVSSKASSP